MENQMLVCAKTLATDYLVANVNSTEPLESITFFNVTEYKNFAKTCRELKSICCIASHHLLYVCDDENLVATLTKLCYSHPLLNDDDDCDVFGFRAEENFGILTTTYDSKIETSNKIKTVEKMTWTATRILLCLQTLTISTNSGNIETF